MRRRGRRALRLLPRPVGSQESDVRSSRETRMRKCTHGGFGRDLGLDVELVSAEVELERVNHRCFRCRFRLGRALDRCCRASCWQVSSHRLYASCESVRMHVRKETRTSIAELSAAAETFCSVATTSSATVALASPSMLGMTAVEFALAAWNARTMLPLSSAAAAGLSLRRLCCCSSICDASSCRLREASSSRCLRASDAATSMRCVCCARKSAICDA